MANPEHLEIPKQGAQARDEWRARVLWLLPAVFIIHDGEEILTMPGWVAGHRRELEQFARDSDVTAEMVRSLPTTTPQVAVAVGLILLLFVAVTAGASLSKGRGFSVPVPGRTRTLSND